MRSRGIRAGERASRRRRPAGAWWPAVVATALLCAPPASAQDGGGAGLDLAMVIREALAASPEVRLGRQDLKAREGELLSARGRFESHLGVSVSGARDQQMTVEAQQDAVRAASLVTDQAAYSLSLRRRLRSGVQIQPEVAVSRVAVGQLAAPTSRASVDLRLVVPLLRDRGGGLVTAAESSARAVYAAETHRLRHEMAATVRDAATAYWSLVAAQARLEVHRESEARAERMAAETEVLVAADERPAADLNQLRANVAMKRMTRIGAEQQLAEARRRLGLVLGVDGSALPELAVAESLPRADHFAPDSATVREMVGEALASRADVDALAGQEAATLLLLRASQGETRARLDLSVGVGYAGMAIGDAGRFLGGNLEQLFTPLYRNLTPGPSLSVQVDYELPFHGTEAKGRAMQQRALLERQQIVAEGLRLQVATGVRIAVEALRRDALMAAEADSAVELYRRTMEAERQKFQLGVSTLFDVILAEDQLTGARLRGVESRLGYALSLAGLRFESGNLVEVGEDRAEVDIGRLRSASGES